MTINLAVLRTEARATAKRQQERLNTAITENRDLTAEEEAADKEDGEKLARLTAQIQRAEAAMAAASAIGADPASPPPSTGPPAATVPANARPPLDTGGFRDLAEFANAVRFANPAAAQSFRVDDRLAAPANVHMENGDEMGSYLVPPEFRQQITNLVFADGNDPIMEVGS